MTPMQNASINLAAAIYYSYLAAFGLEDASGNVPAFESLSGLERTTWIDRAQRVLNEARYPNVIGRITPTEPYGSWRGDAA